MLCSQACYPEGNFGRNQLLDGSMSLSPLFPASPSDLHVSTGTGLQQTFACLDPGRAKLAIFRVAAYGLRLRGSFSRGRLVNGTLGQVASTPCVSWLGSPVVALTTAQGLSKPLSPRPQLAILGPCFKTGRAQASCLREMALKPSLQAKPAQWAKVPSIGY